jgi:hypothetical protein
MVQTPAQSQTETLLLNLPKTLKLYVTPEQFAVLAASNRVRQRKSGNKEYCSF